MTRMTPDKAPSSCYGDNRLWGMGVDVRSPVGNPRRRLGADGGTMGVCDAILYGLDRYRVMPRTVFSIWGVARWFPGIEKTEKNGVC